MGRTTVYGTGTLSLSVSDDEGGRPVLALSGELDMATSPSLAQRLSELVAGGTDVVIDLRELDFIDSSGLGALIAARQQSIDRSASLSLRRPSRTVMRVLSITGLDGVFDIEA